MEVTCPFYFPSERVFFPRLWGFSLSRKNRPREKQPFLVEYCCPRVAITGHYNRLGYPRRKVFRSQVLWLPWTLKSGCPPGL